MVSTDEFGSLCDVCIMWQSVLIVLIFRPRWAIGPFRETYTDQAPGNFLVLGQSHTFWGNGLHRYSPESSHSEGASPLHMANQEELLDSPYATMLASEAVLAINWDTPEDDAAWADL